MPTTNRKIHKKRKPPIGFTPHNHSTCISDVVAAAEAYCRQAGLRFTPIRRQVLEILLEEHRAIGAYSILDRLRKNGFSSQPPIAYRALDFLMTHDLAHKVEKLNAFIACTRPSQKHMPGFMICRVCSSVAETYLKTAGAALGDIAQEAEFRIEHSVIESEGVCSSCSQAAIK